MGKATSGLQLKMLFHRKPIHVSTKVKPYVLLEKNLGFSMKQQHTCISNFALEAYYAELNILENKRRVRCMAKDNLALAKQNCH